MTSPREISLQPVADLPPKYRGWLDPGATPPAHWFARTPAFRFSIVIASLVAIGPLVFLFDLVLRTRSGRKGDPADVIAFAVVFVPLTWWAGRYAWREWRQWRMAKDGRLRVGAFVDRDALLWATTPERAWLIPRDTLASVHVTAGYVHRAPFAPKDVEITTRSGQRIVIDGAGDYDIARLLGALRRCLPGVPVTTAPDLDAWLRRWRREELSRPGSIASLHDLELSEAPAPGPHGDPSIAHLMKLLELAGIGCTKVREASSVGSSLASIDTAELWVLERPLHVRLSLLGPLYDGLGPRDQNWLDAERRKAGNEDPVIEIRQLAFSCLVDIATR